MRTLYGPEPGRDFNRRIAATVRDHERGRRGRLIRPDPPFVPGGGLLFAVTTSLIGNASGTGASRVLGSGTADLYALNADGTRTALGQSVTVWSDEDSAIKSGSLITVGANCGQWVYVRSACSTAVTTGGS